MEETFDYPYDEYCDPDAIACLDDYNRYEENQLALDRDYESVYEGDAYDNAYEDAYDWEDDLYETDAY